MVLEVGAVGGEKELSVTGMLGGPHRWTEKRNKRWHGRRRRSKK